MYEVFLLIFHDSQIVQIFPNLECLVSTVVQKTHLGEKTIVKSEWKFCTMKWYKIAGL